MSFNWLNKKSRIFLSNGYLEKDEDPIDRLWTIAWAAEAQLGIKGYAEKFMDYASKGWILLSSPVWSNFGRKRGLPISCFGSYIPDSMSGIMDTASEIAMMSKMGGGTSAYFGDVRRRGAAISTGGKSDGAVNFTRIFDTVVDTCKQAAVRRGSMACYLPIDHGDIEEFLTIKHEGSPIQHLFPAVTVTDDWMSGMINGDSDKRRVWAKVIKSRCETGLPYILFKDNANNFGPQVYKDHGLEIVASNLCNEIMLSSSEDESFVCCLGSVNVLHFEDWKDTDLVETMMFFLDAVMEEFIVKAKPCKEMARAVKFAERQRAVGLGACGLHSLYQSKMLPFGSLESQWLNIEIFETINRQSLAASEKAAKMYGEPELLEGYGLRWATRMSVAPNTSSAFILGQVSQSIEPLMSNYYPKELAKIDTPIRNQYLKRRLEDKSLDNEGIWRNILLHNGSVQHMEELTVAEKLPFQSFQEIPSMDILAQAIERQRYIDQGQSLNLMLDPDMSAKDINALLIHAWENGIKGLYYQHSTNAAQRKFRDGEQAKEKRKTIVPTLPMEPVCGACE